MSTDVAAPAGGSRRQHRLWRWSLAGCGVNAALWVAAMLYAAGGPQHFFTADSAGAALLFLLWPVAPTLAVALVVVLAHRVWRGGFVASALGVAVLLLITVVSLTVIFASRSSTSALGFLTLPLAEWGAVVFILLATVAGSTRVGSASE